jgi:hypothetical protein
VDWDWLYLAQMWDHWWVMVITDEASGSVKGGELFDQLSKCYLLKKELFMSNYMRVYLSIISFYLPKYVVSWCIRL